MPSPDTFWRPLSVATGQLIDKIEASTVQWSAISALCLFIAFSIWRVGRREGGLPPGPPTVPILGNAHHLSNNHRFQDYKWFQEMAEKYGPVMSIKLGTLTAIIFTDDGTACRELFEKRAWFNGRPINTVARLVGRGIHPIHQTDNNVWRFNRKLLAQHFNSSMACRSGQIKIQEAESTQLLKDLFESTTTTTSYSEVFNRFAASVMTSTAYGIRLPNRDHPLPPYYAHNSSSWMKMYGLKDGGAPPVDAWPWLDYLMPKFIFPWREKCGKISDRVFGMYDGLAATSRSLNARGLIDDTFAHKLFAMQPKQPKLTDDRLSMVLGVAFEGGSDILAGTLCTTLLALLTHPDVQKKGRAEVDLACNQDTIPTWALVEKLQYIRSIGKESLRWRPPFPMGVSHALTQDDEYMGYKLPANSFVAPNIWAIHMNPARYDEPERFKPERFEHHTLATGDYNAVPDHRARDHYAFFPGRRTCPGVYMAEQAQILVTAKLLWAFDILPPPGVSISGIDTCYHTAFQGSIVRIPKDFPVLLKPRSEHRMQVILAEFAHLNTVFFPGLEHDIHIKAS